MIHHCLSLLILNVSYQWYLIELPYSPQIEAQASISFSGVYLLASVQGRPQIGAGAFIMFVSMEREGEDP